MHPKDLRNRLLSFLAVYDTLPDLNDVTQSQTERQLRRGEHELRRKTLRINDGSNQCLPPSAWMTIADRIAN